MSANLHANSEPVIRPVRRVVLGMPTSDGAGVKLTRLLGTPELPDLDPFLLLDQFGTDRAEDYLAGFPDHPHRGFETVTYMLEGRMRHRDNHGNEGLLVPGGVQWMSAGSGLVHSEMPEQLDGAMRSLSGSCPPHHSHIHVLRGFQLWVNLPASDKMLPPRYQEFAPQGIPETIPAPGVRAKVIAGCLGEVIGPVQGVAAQPVYFDIALDAGAEYVQSLPPGHSAFACVYAGETIFGDAATPVAAVNLAVFGEGDAVRMRAGSDGARLILVAGKPFNEPVARYGPFVMNTREEIVQAVEDFRAGRFAGGR